MTATAGTYPYRSEDPLCLPPELTRLRTADPVSRVRVATGDEVWLVTRHEDVRAVLADRRFSRNVLREDAARLIPGVPLGQVSSPFVEPPGHTRWRRLVAKAFTRRHVETLRPYIEEVVGGLVDTLVSHGPPAELMSAFAYPLSITVMCAMLGIEPAQHERFAALADAALTMGDRSPQDRVRAFADLDAFSRALVAVKRADPGEDLLSQLVAVHDADGGRLSEEELVATILAMLVGGYESTVMQIGKSVFVLLRHPDQLTALRAAPSLLGRAIEETLRYAGMDSGYGSPRYALEDVEVAGVTIPKGATVLAIRTCANRDGEAFQDPERFDISRAPGQHLTFGFGHHICLGAALARLQLEVGIGALLHRLPHLRLGVASEDVVWEYRITVAGPAKLPVVW